MDATATIGAGEIVRRFYTLLGEGKVDEVLELLDDDAVVRESADLPYGGDYHGKTGFQELLARMMELVEPMNVTDIEYLEAGDKVVLRMRARFTGRVSGRSAETDIVEVVTVRDGKLLETDVYYRDPSGVAGVVAES
jgi:ketosteroid isomerase-like protein